MRQTVNKRVISSRYTEVLGVLKNTSPGRDMVLGVFSGLHFDRTDMRSKVHPSQGPGQF